MQLVALFKLAFAAAPVLNTLTSLHIVTRRPVLQKVRHHPLGLCLLVSIGFQVLFHSPPGVLFTFPSRYYTLSVTRCGTPDTPRPLQLRIRGCYSLRLGFPTAFRSPLRYALGVLTPSNISIRRFGLFPFRSPLLRKSFVYFLFLRVLRCFSSPGSLPLPYVFRQG